MPKAKPALKTRGAKPSSTPPKPDWPPFKPLLPPQSLRLENIVPNQIVVARNFFTSTLCKTYVNFLKTLPLVTTPGKPKKGDAVRVNDRFQIEDVNLANRLWIETGLRELVCGGEDGVDGESGERMTEDERRELWGGEVIGLNPSIRIYRYTEGQYFDQHYDESNNILLPPTSSTPSIAAKTTWTLLLYLTSSTTDCEGGQTVFYPDPDDLTFKKRDKPLEEVAVELDTGMLLLHRHGDECMLHEGREVTKGEKWVIRSDLCVRR